MEGDNLEIDAKIEVTGFKDLDATSYAKLKKLLEKWSGRYEELCDEFELLSVKMKTVHKKEKSEKYEIHATVTDKGKRFFSETIDRDFFLALNDALEKLEMELSKRK